MPISRSIFRPLGAGLAIMLLSMLAAPGSASGADAAVTCSSAKGKAAGTKVDAKLTCAAKAAIKGQAADPPCLTKAEQRFERAFEKAEDKAQSSGGCATVGDAAEVEVLVDACVNNVRSRLGVAGAAQAASRCTADKLRATGTAVNGSLVCWAKAAARRAAVDSGCLAKAAARYGSGFARAESSGDCLTTGDAAAVSTAVDDCVDAIVPALGGSSTTTTITSPASTTTTLACGAEPAAVRGVTARHNQVRASATPAPNPPLNPLCYSTTVQATAQAWADRCRFEHNTALRGVYGENIAAYGSASATAVSAAGLWAAEAPNYTYSNNRCSGVCGHYTQMVWRSTQRLGCGIKVCTTGSPFGPNDPSWTFIVCNYDPPGNWVGQRPY